MMMMMMMTASVFPTQCVSLLSVNFVSVIKRLVWSHEKRLARPTQIPEKIEKRTREEETSTVNKYNIIPTIPVWFHTRNIYQRWFCWERKTVRCTDLKRKSFRFDDDDDGGNRSRVMMIRLFIYLFIISKKKKKTKLRQLHGIYEIVFFFIRRSRTQQL
jgi:hypothetical protein